MHGAPQLGLGPVLESADDVDIDVEADEEGDAELQDSGHNPEADPGEAAPVLLADLDVLAVEFINFDIDTFVKPLLHTAFLQSVEHNTERKLPTQPPL